MIKSKTNPREPMPRKPKEPPKDCKRCGVLYAVPVEKYCKHCEKQLLIEMDEAGHLAEPRGIKTTSEPIGRKVIEMVDKK